MMSTDEVSGDEHRFVKWHTNHFGTNSKYFKSTYFEDTKETRVQNTVSKPVHDKFILGAPTNYYYNADINTQGNIHRSAPLMFESDILEFIREDTDDDKKYEKKKEQLKNIIDNAIHGKKAKELSHKFIDFKLFKKSATEPIKIYLQSSPQNYLKRFDFFVSDEEKTEKEDKNVLYLRFVPSNLPDMLRAFENFDAYKENKTSLSKTFKKWQHNSTDEDSESKEFICKRIICTRKNYEDVHVLYGTVTLKPTSSKTSVELIPKTTSEHYVKLNYHIKLLKDLKFYFTANYEASDEFHIIPSITDRHKCLKLVKKVDIEKFKEFLNHESKDNDKYPFEYVHVITQKILSMTPSDDFIGEVLALTYHFKDDSTLSRIWTKHYTANIPEYELVFTPLSLWKVCCDMPFKEKQVEVQSFVEKLPLKKLKVYSLPARNVDQESYINKPMDIYVHKIKDEQIQDKKYLNKLQTLQDLPDDFKLGETILNKLRGIRQTSEIRYDSEAKKFCRLILSETETQFGNRFKQRYGQVCSFTIRHALMKYFAKKSLTKNEMNQDGQITYDIKISDELPFENSSIQTKLSLGFFFPKKQNEKELFVYTSDYGVKMGIPLMYQKNLQIVPQLLTGDDDTLKSSSLFGSKYCVFINSNDCKHKFKDDKDAEQTKEIKPLFHRYKMYAIILSLIDYVKNTTIQNSPLILVVKTDMDENLWRSQLSFVLKLFPLGSSSFDLSWDDPRNLALFQKNAYEIISINDDEKATTSKSSSNGFLIRPFPTLEELTTMMRFLLEKGDQLFIEEHDKEPVVPVKNVCSSIDFMCMDMGKCDDDCDMNVDFMMHGMDAEPTEPDTPKTRRRDRLATAAETRSSSKKIFQDPLDTDDEDSSVPDTLARRIKTATRRIRHANAAERQKEYSDSSDDALSPKK